MIELKGLVKQIHEADEVLNTDLTEWPRDTLPGMQIRQAQAKQELNGLIRDYRKAFFERVGKVFVSGQNNKQTFLNLMKSEVAFFFQADDLYREMANYVKPQAGEGGTFGTAAYIKLVEVAGAFAQKYGMYPVELIEPTHLEVADSTDLVSVVKTTIRKAYGDSLNNAHILTALYEKALKNRFVRDVALLVVYDLTEEERAVLLESILPGNPNFVVDLNDDEVPTRSLTGKIYSRVHDTFRKMGKLPQVVTQAMDLRDVVEVEVVETNNQTEEKSN